MNEDPLAGFLSPEEPTAAAPAPAAPKPAAPKATPAAAPAPSAAASSAPAAAAAPLPGFFSSFGSSKTYPATGEGLRDAIKDKDVPGVKQVLKQNPGAAKYQDRLSQTMLHLAAIFDHTEIAELLLGAGADPSAKNSDGETAMDVAQPTLKRKMLAVCGVFSFFCLVVVLLLLVLLSVVLLVSGMLTNVFAHSPSPAPPALSLSN
jgi:hypothetical protein